MKDKSKNLAPLMRGFFCLLIGASGTGFAIEDFFSQAIEHTPIHLFRLLERSRPFPQLKTSVVIRFDIRLLIVSNRY
mgnify:CR=1 FL=1